MKEKNFKQTTLLIGGLGAGAALMYLLGVRKGRRQSVNPCHRDLRVTNEIEPAQGVDFEDAPGSFWHDRTIADQHGKAPGIAGRSPEGREGSSAARLIGGLLGGLVTIYGIKRRGTLGGPLSVIGTTAMIWSGLMRDHRRRIRPQNRDWYRISYYGIEDSSDDRENSSDYGYENDFSLGFQDDHSYPHSYLGSEPDYGRAELSGEYRPGSGLPTSNYSEVWFIPGPYTGKGPSGWRRSDDRISEDLNERLHQHGQIDASGIIVSVSEGAVILSGSVNSRFEKRMAEDVAESCLGVKEVHNNLRVSSREQGQNLHQASHQLEQTQTGQPIAPGARSTTGQS